MRFQQRGADRSYWRASAIFCSRWWPVPKLLVQMTQPIHILPEYAGGFDDPEKRIAELERQLAEQKRIAELERQLAEQKRIAELERQLAEAKAAARGVHKGLQFLLARSCCAAPGGVTRKYLSSATRAISGQWRPR